MSEKKSLNRFDGLDGEPCAIPRFDSEADNVFGGDLAVKCPVCQTVNFSRKDSYYECDFGHKWPKKSKDTPHLDDSEELGEKK